MPPVITVRRSDGTVRCCDQKCYDAQTPSCHCVCGGRNHGVGLDKAIKNTQKYAEQLKRFARAAEPDSDMLTLITVTLPARLKNLCLPDPREHLH